MNKHRGEISIKLKTGEGDREFAMRPTFQAIADIETATGEGIVYLAQKINARNIAVRDLAAIVTAGLRAAGEPADQSKVGEMIYKTGVLTEDLLRSVNDFMTAALTGGETADTKKNTQNQ